MAKPKLIEVSPEEEAILKKIREENVRNLEEQLAAEKKRLASLNHTHGTIPLFVEVPMGYDKRASLPKRITFNFGLKKKVLTAREVYSRIVEFEPNLKDKDGSQKFYNDVSSALSGNAKIGRYFKRYKPTQGSEFKYGLSEWFDANGNPHQEYRND